MAMDQAISMSTIVIPDNFLAVEAEKKLMRNAVWFLKKWSGFALHTHRNDNQKAGNDNGKVEA
jgi:hypothetical protein